MKQTEKVFTEGYLAGVERAEELIEANIKEANNAQSVFDYITAFDNARNDIAYEARATKAELEVLSVPREIREAQVLLQQFFGSKATITIKKNGVSI